MATLKKSELDIALERLTPQWLAGFFDGEGCITVVRHHNDMPSLVVNVTQCDENTLALIAMKFGGKVSIRKTPHANKTIFFVQWGGRSALPLLECILPHVILKRKLVEWGIQLGRLHGDRGNIQERPTRTGKGSRSMDPGLREQREKLFKSIRAENQAGRIVQ